MKNSYLQVITTIDNLDTAKKIALAVTDKRLASCAQLIGPIQSYYWWKGKREEGSEWQVVMKTRLEIYPQLEQEILSMHPYEVPEIIAMPITQGLESYLKWIGQETKE